MGGVLARPVRFVFRCNPNKNEQLLRKDGEAECILNRLDNIDAAQVVYILDLKNELKNVIAVQEEHASHIKNMLAVQADLLETIVSQSAVTKNTNASISISVAALSEGIENIAKKVTHFNDVIEKLPDNIEETAKKYSAYLHDEHTQIYDVVSKPTFQRRSVGADWLPKSTSLPPSPRISETSPKTTQTPFQASRPGEKGVLPPFFSSLKESKPKRQENMFNSKFFPKTIPSDSVPSKGAEGARANTRLALTPIYIPKST